MSEMVPFAFQGNQIRTFLGEDGEPWFVARDVAEVLGYLDTDQALRKHCKCLKILKPVDLTGLGIEAPSPRGLGVIPERDIYRLIMRSDKPEAEKFEEWVVGEVLPAIRRTGSYHPQQQSTGDMLVHMAEAYREQERRIQALEAQEQETRSMAERARAEVEDFKTGAEHFSITAYHKLFLNESISNDQANRDGKKLSGVARNQGIDLGKAPHPVFGTVNTYPKAMLDAFYRGEYEH